MSAYRKTALEQYEARNGGLSNGGLSKRDERIAALIMADTIAAALHDVADALRSQKSLSAADLQAALVAAAVDADEVAT